MPRIEPISSPTIIIGAIVADDIGSILGVPLPAALTNPRPTHVRSSAGMASIHLDVFPSAVSILVTDMCAIQKFLFHFIYVIVRNNFPPILIRNEDGYVI
jgi:hypothetical protein